MTDHKQQLQSQLWNIANVLRGNMGADEFRDYILGLIFYKYLSEKIELWADKQLKSDGIKFTDLIDHQDREDYLEGLAEESVGALGFFLKPHQLFSVLAARGGEHSEGHDTLIQDVEEAFRDIEQSVAGAESSDDFDGLFNEIDLYSSKLGKDKSQRAKLIGKVLINLNNIDFQLENTEIDVLGDAYEYLISQFASGAGKKAGEFYTPQEVSSILSKIVTTGKDKLESVYDPTCGSGSLLLRVAKEVEKVGMFYGQEMNPTTYNLARMNMILHDVSYRFFDIKQDDTLERPQHDGQLFEAIVANPPFSAKWSADSLKMDEPRFGQYGKLAPQSKADYAFVTHMLHHLSDSGTMALVLPHGALFRGAAEGHIRKHIIEECNWLDAVIGLPANIFYGTSIPTCIMVFKKNRSYDDAVLFIDASNEFEKQKNQNYLKAEHIDKIIWAYENRENIEGYSKNVLLDELRENDFNLGINRFFDSYEYPQIESKESLKLAVESKKNTLSQLTQIVDTSFEIPNEEYITFKLGDICNFYRGKGLPKVDLDMQGDNQCIHYGELFTDYGEIINSVNSKTNYDGFKSKKGDIIIPSSDVTPLGLATASALMVDGVVLGGDINVIRIVDKILLPEYLSFYLNWHKGAILRIVSGTTVKHLYNKDLKKLVVRFPRSLELQKKISSALFSINVIKSDLEYLNETLDKVKNSFSNEFIKVTKEE